MASVNKVILVGNLGQDPEVRYSQAGTAMVNITIATSDRWKDKQTGEKKKRTEWHRVVFFNRLAEIVGEYLHKGRSIYVEGRLQTRKFEDKSGNERYITEVVATEMQMLGARGDSEGSEGGSRGGDEYDQSPPPSSSGSSSGSGGGGGGGAGKAGSGGSSGGAGKGGAPADAGGEDFDDDIPF